MNKEPRVYAFDDEVNSGNSVVFDIPLTKATVVV